MTYARTIFGWTATCASLLFIGLLVTSCGHPAYAHDRGNEGAIKVDPAGIFSPVVQIQTDGGKGFCTGFYIGGGKFVTAGHCLRDTKSGDGWKLVTENPNGGTHNYRPDFYLNSFPGSYAGQDFSVIFVDPKLVDDLTPLKLDCTYSPKIGDGLVMEGFPEDMGRLVTTGAVAAAKATPWALWTKPVIRAQLPGSYGNSGSPVSLTDGEVIGIAVGLLPNDRSLMGIQPISVVCSALGLDVEKDTR